MVKTKNNMNELNITTPISITNKYLAFLKKTIIF